MNIKSIDINLLKFLKTYILKRYYVLTLYINIYILCNRKINSKQKQILKNYEKV